MAQQAVRRIRRTAGKPAAFGRGLAVSVLATAAAVIVFALSVSFVDVSDGVIRIINQLIKAAAVFLGECFANPVRVVVCCSTRCFYRFFWGVG